MTNKSGFQQRKITDLRNVVKKWAIFDKSYVAMTVIIQQQSPPVTRKDEAICFQSWQKTSHKLF